MLNLVLSLRLKNQIMIQKIKDILKKSNFEHKFLPINLKNHKNKITHNIQSQICKYGKFLYFFNVS